MHQFAARLQVASTHDRVHPERPWGIVQQSRNLVLRASSHGPADPVYREHILQTPLPLVYAIKRRRFLAPVPPTLSLALLHRVNGDWLVSILPMIAASPLRSLDQIDI